MTSLVEEWRPEALRERIAMPTTMVVYFTARWCMPCRDIAPRIAEWAREYAGKVTFAKVDVDENQEYAQENAVEVVPTFLLFRNGREVNRVPFAMPSMITYAVQSYLLTDGGESCDGK
jgi:thioredoxin